jgi:hypothetical protein
MCTYSLSPKSHFTDSEIPCCRDTSLLRDDGDFSHIQTSTHLVTLKQFQKWQMPDLRPQYPKILPGESEYL